MFVEANVLADFAWRIHLAVGNQEMKRNGETTGNRKPHWFWLHLVVVKPISRV